MGCKNNQSPDENKKRDKQPVQFPNTTKMAI
jgi:hypothetical protein